MKPYLLQDHPVTSGLYSLIRFGTVRTLSIDWLPPTLHDSPRFSIATPGNVSAPRPLPAFSIVLYIFRQHNISVNYRTQNVI